MPDGMPPQVLLDRWFAKTYNWTPDQVKKLPLDDLVWFPIIEEAENNVAEKMSKEASRSSSGPTRRVLGR